MENNMIIGVGTDIIEISRVEKAVKRTSGLLEKIFTPEEIKSAGNGRRSESLAGYFAAKEAMGKALGTGIRGFSFKDIEVYKDSLGKPCIKVTGPAENICDSMGVRSIHLSISHSRDNAMAFIVLEG
ncbi:holo-ACP synthase [Alloiococcus sp. CFN-8]|uniref:holo-ACP synthase n=1 Tax=Alloiococcus sp. CFN-8 TaxID=3416081 RepID=UPI003CE913D4